MLTFLLAAALAEGVDIPPGVAVVWESMDDVERLEAHFTQIRYSTLLSTPFTSSGTLRFERPNRLAWLVEEPAVSAFVIDGTQVGMAMPDLGIRQELELSASPEIARIVEGMIWLGRDLEQLSESYSLLWSSPTLQLTPIDPTLQGMIESIELTVGGSPPQVQAVTVREPSGDRVEITLTNIRENPSLSPSAFQLP